MDELYTPPRKALNLFIGALFSKKEALQNILRYPSAQLAAGAYILITLFSSLVLILNQFISYLLMNKFYPMAFSDYFYFEGLAYFKVLIYIILLWVFIMLIIYGISRLLGGTAGFIAFLEYSAFMYIYTTLFIFALILFKLGGVYNSAAPILSAIALAIILLISLLINLTKGVRELNQIETGKTLVVVVIALLIIGLIGITAWAVFI